MHQGLLEDFTVQPVSVKIETCRHASLWVCAVLSFKISVWLYKQSASHTHQNNLSAPRSPKEGPGFYGAYQLLSSGKVPILLAVRR